MSHRRRYTQELKIEAVKLLTEQSMSPAEAAESRGVNPDTLAK